MCQEPRKAQRGCGDWPPLDDNEPACQHRAGDQDPPGMGCGERNHHELSEGERDAPLRVSRAVEIGINFRLRLAFAWYHPNAKRKPLLTAIRCHDDLTVRIPSP